MTMPSLVAVRSGRVSGALWRADSAVWLGNFGAGCCAAGGVLPCAGAVFGAVDRVCACSRAIPSHSSAEIVKPEIFLLIVGYLLQFPLAIIRRALRLVLQCISGGDNTTPWFCLGDIPNSPPNGRAV